MIALDTNVLSALMRTQPDDAVVEWLDEQPAESIWTTTVTVFEIRTGIDLLVPSRRRRRLESALELLINDKLDSRVLSFDTAAAHAAGALAAREQRAGRTIEVRDAQVAGIALARRATLATGNLRHFTDLGVRLLDPWHPAAPKRR